jgi:hypothetical protein
LISGDLESVFALPGIPSEKVVDCALVPTYLKSQSELVMMQVDDNDDDEEDSPVAKQPSGMLRATITPAVLVLTKRSYSEEGEEEATTRHLKIVRCPAADMANWAFEVGSLAEPRLAREVLPGSSCVTVSVTPLLYCLLCITSVHYHTTCSFRST